MDKNISGTLSAAARLRASVSSGAGLKAAVDVMNTGALPLYFGSTAYWNATPDLIGKKDHIYVYTDYAEIERDGEKIAVPNIKIGDGSAFLIDNPFITTSVEELLEAHIADDVRHITEEERSFWNNKVSCYLDEQDEENVIFSTD